MKQLFVLLPSLFFTLMFHQGKAQQEVRSNRDFQWLMQLKPNMTLSAYWFFWSNGSTAITMNAQLESPTPWVSEISLENATSSSCSEIGTMKVDLVAPSIPGIYTARIVDLNENYDPINVTLLVSDELIPLDSINLSGFVNQAIVVPEPRINDGKADMGCLDPFYPSESESYDLFWDTDGIPGSISTNPSQFTLLNEEQIVLQNSATFTQAGNYTAYRYGKVEFSNALWVLKVNFSIAENPTGINKITSVNTNPAYPNPAVDFVVIPSNENGSLYSIDGKFIKVLNAVDKQSNINIDVKDLNSSVYIAKIGVSNFKIIKQ